MIWEKPEQGGDGMSEVTGKSDEVPETTAGSNPRDDAKRVTRRRLLLGAAALPSVYTLTSGAAVAASSINCWANQPQTTTAPRITTAPDRWYRVQVKSGTEGQSTNIMGYCLKDTQ